VARVKAQHGILKLCGFCRYMDTFSGTGKICTNIIIHGFHCSLVDTIFGLAEKIMAISGVGQWSGAITEILCLKAIARSFDIPVRCSAQFGLTSQLRL
jgi:hypothetical protein